MARRTTAAVATELNSVGVTAAGRVLGVSRPTVYDWIREGQLRAYPRPGMKGRTGAPALRVLIADLERLRRKRSG